MIWLPSSVQRREAAPLSSLDPLSGTSEPFVPSLVLEEPRPHDLKLSLSRQPPGSLAASGWLFANRAIGISNAHALPMALQRVDSALPLKPLTKPLGGRPEGVNEVCGLQADR